jgi:fatty-acyl-CoA synthase
MSASDVQSKEARDAWVRALGRTAAIEREPRLILPVLIDGLADRYEDSPALSSPAGSLSYRGLAIRMNQYSRFGLAQGLAAGDCVCLMLGNCAEYVAVWLGLARIGVTVALVNTQLSGDPLALEIANAAPRLIIVGADWTGVVAELPTRLRSSFAIWVLGRGDHTFSSLEPQLAELPSDRVPDSLCATPTLDMTALYIYTSGTSGMPKAAKVSHYRVLSWSYWFAGLMDTQPDDRMYDCLPLYHSIGGVVAVGATLVGGGAVIIRPRFSAKDFWREVSDQRCTLFQYIGELCRYLVNAPVQPNEADHRLRLACGNGLKADVWERFKSRFRIPRILEYYASTEGNFSLYNCEGEPGAVGRIPPFLAHRLPVALVRFDADSEQPMRNAAGFCELCDPDEIGEALGLIPTEKTRRAGRFEGYVDDDSSARKVLRDVFKTGDSWYRTGDLMRRDGRGYYYFVDRIGDTYRWKGENVSTSEVWATLSAGRGVVDGVVYGVALPGVDGRAGTAALIVDDDFDLGSFHDHTRRLPAYARPVFLRLPAALEFTATFKPRKQDLVRLGVDPAKSADPLYFDNSRSGAYVLLDAALYAMITGGSIRL